MIWSTRARAQWILFAVAAVMLFVVVPSASATSVLPYDEDPGGSDAVISVTSGSYDSGTDEFSFTGTSGQIKLAELNGHFGAPATTYLTYGTSVVLDNVLIDSSGTLTNSGVGTLELKYTGPPSPWFAGSLASAYPLAGGGTEVLLAGNVVDALAGPAGGLGVGIVQLQVNLTGGILGPGAGAPHPNPFGPLDIAVLNINVGSGNSFSDVGGFTFSGTGTDLWGTAPEPTSLGIAGIGTILLLSFRSPRARRRT